MRPAFFAIVLALLVSAAPAAAQSRGDRALFGGGVGSAEQVLSANSRLGMSFLDTIGTSPSVTGLSQPLPDSTTIGQANANLAYVLALSWLRVNAGIGVLGMRYTAPERLWLTQSTYNLSADTSRAWELSPRFSVNGMLGAQLRPSFWAMSAMQGQVGTASGFELDPLLILPPDVASMEGRTVEGTGALGVTYRMTERASVVADARLLRRLELGGSENFDLLERTGMAGVMVNVTRHLRVRGGYRFSETTVDAPEARPVRSQGLELGVDYNRGGTLRLTKRTTLAGNAGLGAAVDSHGTERLFALGNVRLNHELGRTWQTGAEYRRTLEFPSFVLEPTLLDTAQADLRGLLSRRLTFTSLVAYQRGAVGFSGGDNGLSRTSAIVMLQAGLTRYLALGASYGYYSRQIGADVVTAAGLGRRSESQLVNVFATTWAPLLHRTRRPSRATR
ncbi:MAG: hypothetical protein IT184_10030 [Acidobacteria bacterium]|nr:hypothetical protein [Acidobacteriota bacterium]